MNLFKLKKITNFLPFKIQNYLEKKFLNMLYLLYNKFMIVEIETITTCNRRCGYCPNSIYERSLLKNEKKIKKELFYKIIDDLSKMNFKGNIRPHFYGEPLLDDRLPEFIKYIKQNLKKSTVSIFTNGDYLNLAKYKDLVLAGVNEFVITDHSNSVFNFNEIKDYIKKNKKYKVQITFEPLKILYNRSNTIKLSDDKKKIRSCVWPSQRLTINYKGDIILCCNDYFSSIIFGNINKNTIQEIWNFPKFIEYRKKILKNNNFLEICKNCYYEY